MNVNEELGKYKNALADKLVPVLDEYLLCELKIQELWERGKQENRLNSSHLEMIEKLQTNKFAIKQEIDSILQRPLIHYHVSPKRI